MQCGKKTEATQAVQQIRELKITRRASTSEAGNTATATGSIRVVLGLWPKRVAEGGGDEEEMADEDEDEEEEAAGQGRDIMMAETEAAIKTRTDTETETETGSLATNDSSSPAQQPKDILIEHWGVGDGSRTQGRRSVLARATASNSRYRDLAFGRLKGKMKKIFARDTAWECAGG
jgi:hypothetical protein